MTREEFLVKLPEWEKNYQASPEVLQKIGKLTLLIIIGPSGVGKSTVIKALGVPYVPSDTTRPRRAEEVDGRDYLFRDDYGRLAKEIENGRFVQIAVGSGGDFYGTRASSYPDEGLATMAVVADVVPDFRRMGFGRTISAFIVPPSSEEWMHRMDSHPMSAEQRQKRLAEARRSLNFALKDSETHLVLCEIPKNAARQIIDLTEGRVDEQREVTARLAARQCLDTLN